MRETGIRVEVAEAVRLGPVRGVRVWALVRAGMARRDAVRVVEDMVMQVVGVGAVEEEGEDAVVDAVDR